ncbi:myosin-1-like [Eurosta solidaginis]|uniref:myosin-1-like n=1 Tax=Eurosta solidaginis TaxID=178769 RepID=UPI0035313673
MAKFSELKIQQLKKELGSRGLNTSGVKLEFQARLREAMEAEGIDVEEYVFHLDGEETTKIEEKNETSQTVTSTDLNMILAAISAQTSTVASMSSQISEMSSQLEEQKTHMASQLESQENRITSKMEAQEARISEMSSQMSSQLEEQKTYMASQLESHEIRISEMSTQITSKMETQLKEQEARISSKLEARMDEKITQFEEKFEAEVDALRGRIQELQLNRPAASANNTKVRTPSFDGSVPFQAFKQQFEKTAAVNNWNVEDKVAALFMALKGPAAEILQTIPEGERNCYEALMGALERRYGTEHRRQIYQMELLNRFQRPGETLQEFASDIERLAHLANADAPVEYTERVKIQSFINGIRDVETKRATYANPKPTFAETVSQALIQETASLLCKPVFKARRVEVERPEWVDAILEALKGSQKRSEKVIKCFKCGKSGHITRHCDLGLNSSNNVGGRKRKAGGDEQERVRGRELDPAIECPVISVSQIGRKSSSLTVRGNVDGKERVLTVDTGASHSLIRSDLVNRRVKSLPGAKLRTVTGEYNQVQGEVICEVLIGKVMVLHKFVVAEIVDEVILGVDVLVDHDIKIDIQRRVMRYENQGVPLNFSLEKGFSSNRVLVEKTRRRPRNSKVKVDGTNGPNKSKPKVPVRETLVLKSPNGRTKPKKECKGGFKPRHTTVVKCGNDTDYAKQIRPAQALRSGSLTKQQNVKERPRVTSSKMKHWHDKNFNSEGFLAGDLVLLNNPHRRKGVPAKFRCTWEGPYKVVKKISDTIYRIQTTGKPRIRRVVHLEMLAAVRSGDLSDRDDQT